MDVERRSAGPEVEVRRITEADIVRNETVLSDLLADNFESNMPFVENPVQLAGTEYDRMLGYQRDGSAILIGAFDEMDIVGFVWAYRREVLGQPRLHVGHIVVDSRTRSRGVGAALLKALEEMARAEGIPRLELMASVDNERTIRFYESNGFATVRVQLEKEMEGAASQRPNGSNA
ncbi:MAG: GNAT family N-acetyltransferase [Coriobacteriia bacterium]|nr:GNAT family N-acetyltransferase [Coriobacteriia bacterium]